LRLLNEIESRKLTVVRAAVSMGRSERQVYRLLARYRREGAAALAHGNRGRPSARRIADPVRAQVVELLKAEYHDYNDYHLTDILAEEHDLLLSRSTVRRIRREVGLPSPRKRRAPRHRSRRERRPQPGMLLQLDGSDHDWLDDRGPRLVLIAAIDDATGEVPFALFRPAEDAAGYFLLLRQIVKRHGLPLALYADRHTIFQSPKPATLEQELAGEPPRSQFGRLVDKLGIELIPAYSPQAKGRVERLFGTLQDRLVKALRRAEARTLEDANRVLAHFLPGFNRRFRKPPAQPEPAYLPWPTGLDPELLFCFQHRRRVYNDNTFPFSGHRLQIPPDRHRANYAGCRVEVRQHMDGRLSAWYQGRKLITYTPEQPGPPQVEKFTPAARPANQRSATVGEKPRLAKTKRRQPWKPPADHPWRKPFKITAKPKDTPY
ncbi:MAG: ISNCY family transposase, partial [Anaerolineales bacterium]